MRKKLVGAAVAALGVAAFGLGGTFAGFTDTEDSEIQAEAGTLDLTLSSDQTDSTGAVTFADMQPGQTRQYFLRLTNDGDVRGTTAYAFSDVVNHENGCLPVEQEAGDTCSGVGDQGDLGRQLKLTFHVLGEECAATGGTVIEPSMYPADRPSVGFEDLGVTLGEDEVVCVRADILFEDKAGNVNNRAQGDSTEFRFDFRLEQVT